MNEPKMEVVNLVTLQHMVFTVLRMLKVNPAEFASEIMDIKSTMDWVNQMNAAGMMLIEQKKKEKS